jgi:hydroxymethylpyrimidine/phosphomethylpyrimidine kinase
MPAPVVLIVAGSDSGGGAGIQADLKACEANGAFGTTSIAALTAQNTVGVQGVFGVSSEFVVQQMDSVLDDIGAHAIKTGMLATKEVIEAVAARIKSSGVKNVVIDPVMVARSGDPLIADDAVASFKTELFPLATIITPNLPEAGFLLGRTLDSASQMEAAAKELLSMGPQAVLLKGGHLAGSEEIVDFFATAEGVVRLPQATIETQNTHGTGCTLASTIAANLAKQVASPSPLADGKVDLLQAVKASAAYLHDVLEVSAAHSIGKGANGPLNHQRASEWVVAPEGVATKQPDGEGGEGTGQAESMPRTQKFWDAALASISASEEHSFLLGMVDGTLPADRFQYYVKQDSLYLLDFAQCLTILSDHAGVSAADSALLKMNAKGCAVAVRKRP